ncbi:hypothetical protein PHISP_03141 [Aspergillus sp. HF37]|nr:hypothetical protein PHISP_03141 [Aspergillus sp. HF37]
MVLPIVRQSAENCLQEEARSRLGALSVIPKSRRKAYLADIGAINDLASGRSGAKDDSVDLVQGCHAGDNF